MKGHLLPPCPPEWLSFLGFADYRPSSIGVEREYGAVSRRCPLRASMSSPMMCPTSFAHSPWQVLPAAKGFDPSDPVPPASLLGLRPLCPQPRRGGHDVSVPPCPNETPGLCSAMRLYGFRVLAQSPLCLMCPPEADSWYYCPRP